MVQVQCFPRLTTHNTLSRGIVGAKIERRARILRTYQWIDHRAKVARKKPRKLTRCAPEKNRVDVQTQRDRELKKGEKSYIKKKGSQET